MTPLNYDDVLSKKLDQILAKVEEKSDRTRGSLEAFKEEMKGRVLSLEGRVSGVEQTVESLQKEVNDFSMVVNKRMLNLFKALLDPSVYRDASWNVYYQEQVTRLGKTISTASSKNNNNA